MLRLHLINCFILPKDINPYKAYFYISKYINIQYCNFKLLVRQNQGFESIHVYIDSSWVRSSCPYWLQRIFRIWVHPVYIDSREYLGFQFIHVYFIHVYIDSSWVHPVYFESREYLGFEFIHVYIDSREYLGFEFILFRLTPEKIKN